MGRYSGKACRLLSLLFLTLGFFILEVSFGYISNSVALIADSFHMLSDVLALVIAFICMKFSKKTRSSKNTYGWARAEVLGALVNTVFLIALSFSIILESIRRFFQYEYINNPKNVLIVGAAGFAVNIIGLFLFHGHGGHGHSHGCRFRVGPKRHNHAEEDESSGRSEATPSRNSTAHERQGTSDSSDAEEKPHRHNADGGRMNMRGVYLHILGDAFGSIVVILNAVVIWQVDNEYVKRYFDPFISLIISAIIICTSQKLLKESSLVLLQTVPSHIDVPAIERKLLTQFNNLIVALHDFHVWRLTGNKIVATAHIICRAGIDYMRLSERLKEFFHEGGIHSTTLQLEVSEVEQIAGQHCVLKCPNKANGRRVPCLRDVCCAMSSSVPVQTGPPTTLGINRRKVAPVSTPDSAVSQSSYI